MCTWRLAFTDLSVSVLPVSAWDFHAGLVNLGFLVPQVVFIFIHTVSGKRLCYFSQLWT